MGQLRYGTLYPSMISRCLDGDVGAYRDAAHRVRDIYNFAIGGITAVQGKRQTRWLIQRFLRYPKAKGHRLLRPERQRSTSSCRSSPRRFLQHLEAIQRPGPLRCSPVHRRIPCYGLGHPEVGTSISITVIIIKC